MRRGRRSQARLSGAKRVRPLCVISVRSLRKPVRSSASSEVEKEAGMREMRVNAFGGGTRMLLSPWMRPLVAGCS